MHSHQTLAFSAYKFTDYTPPPRPSLNGGLYTGEAFNGPHGNVPVTPDTTTYLNENLPADAPTAARYMYPPTRTGNSRVEWRGLKPWEGTPKNWGPHNIYCAPCTPPEKAQCYCDEVCPKTQTPHCNKENCRARPAEPKRWFSKYAYLP